MDTVVTMEAQSNGYRGNEAETTLTGFRSNVNIIPIVLRTGNQQTRMRFLLYHSYFMLTVNKYGKQRLGKHVPAEPKAHASQNSPQATNFSYIHPYILTRVEAG
jgi:hypothetical protein